MLLRGVAGTNRIALERQFRLLCTGRFRFDWLFSVRSAQVQRMKASMFQIALSEVSSPSSFVDRKSD